MWRVRNGKWLLESGIEVFENVDKPFEIDNWWLLHNTATLGQGSGVGSIAGEHGVENLGVWGESPYPRRSLWHPVEY